ncbi:hypothetical protein PAXINDRAFT_10144 [Paxillus involutus ATCC 200175]|nr:hypothetical protein PAXINDRAFT_10144 [Paxillus involutus ATCC 200175]
MSYRNATLAHIMEMGDHIMMESSGDPNLAKFNLVTKMMVMLAKASPDLLANEDRPAWAEAWRLAVKVLFMLTRCANKGQGKRVRMPMGDAQILAGGEVQYTAMLVVWGGAWEDRGSWRMFLDEELADLKAAMERTLGETEEADALFDHDRMCMENRWCPWCCTQADGELI